MTFPLPANEQERLDALKRLNVLDSPAELTFDRITALCARLFDVPFASISLVDGDRQWFKSHYGLDMCQAPRDVSFCGYTIQESEVFVVPDATLDRRFDNNPFVADEPHVRFYAGAPLIGREGQAVGTLCILDTQSHDLSENERKTLQDLAAVVVDELELRLTVRLLAEGTKALGEDRLRLLERVAINANDAILITEAELINEPGPRIVYSNRAFLELTGYALEEIIGRSPRLLQGKDTSRESCHQIRLALEARKPTVVDLLNYKKDGTPFWVEMSITPIANESGEVTHYISIQRNITERRLNQEALRTAKSEAEVARAEAERANAAKSEFLSRMSHELRTPLNGVLGYAQLLEMSTLEEEGAQSVEQIIKAGRHLLALINEVLDIARIESGQMSLSPEPLEASEVALQTLDLVRPLARMRGIEIRDKAARNCKLAVMADQQRLKQILLNLLSNAVKYNRDGGTATFGVEEHGECVRFSVRDSGAGIPPENMARLWTPFDRLGAENSGVEGAGVGLAVSQSLARAMGSQLYATSEVGYGSTFWLDLPRSILARDSVKVVALPDNPPMSSTRLVVLYIEDNLSNLQLVQRLLARRPETRLLSAMQGTLGYELAQSHCPDLILLDVHLPDISGDEVLKQLKSNTATASIPVIMLSADASPGRITRALEAGARNYLPKPLDVPAFFACLDEVAARKNKASTIIED